MGRQRRSGARWSAFGALLALIFLASCEGSGSDVGPRFEDADRRILVGTVLDRRGEPLRAVRVQIGTAVGATDASGRFRVVGPPRGKAVLSVDGELATAPDGRFGFGALAQELDFAGSRDEIDRSFVLPARLESATAELPLATPLAPGTELVDPLTGARLLLGGATLRWSGGGAAPAQVELGFATLEPDDALAPPTGAEVLQNGAAAWIGPPGVALEGAVLLLPDPLRFDAAAEPLRALGLRSVDGLFEELGPASLEAGSVRFAPTRCETGLLYAVRALAPAQTTAIEGQVLDPDGSQVGLATLNVGARDAKAKSNGSFSATSIPAVDGTGAPLALELRLEAPQGWSSAGARIGFTAQPGATIDLGDLELDSTRVADFRGLVVRRGLEDVGRRVTIGNLRSGKRSAWSDEEGKVSIFDLPTGSRTGFDAHLRERVNENKTFADARFFSVSSSSGYRESRLFLDEQSLQRTRLQGSALFQVYVRGTVAPIERAYCMIGLDGEKKGRRRSSSDGGTASFSNAGNGFGIYTAGLQTDARSQDGVHDRLLVISYHTYYGVDSRRAQMQIATAIDPGERPRGAPYGVVRADVLGLTDPLATPPSNLAYSARGRAQRRATRGEIAAELFQLEVDEPIAANDRPALLDRASFADPELVLSLPLEPAYAFAVERDGDAAGRGPITKVGLIGTLEVEGGAAVSRAIAMQPGVPAARTLVLNDCDPVVLSIGPRVQFGWELGDDDAVLVGSVDDAVWDPLARRLDLAPPLAPPPFAGEAFVHVRFDGVDAGGSIEQQAVVPAGVGTLGFDLVIVPRLVAPAPGGELDPEVGLSFTADPRSNATRVILRRETIVKVDGERFLARFEWVVDIAPGVQEIVFPTLPQVNVGGRPVPQFFSPGIYEVEILSWRAENLDFNDWAAHRAILEESEGVPLAVSRYRTSVVVR
ncbi:MAG: hypothetical protein IPN34_05760 [Planctomycetes bacterium]|nr:hypothetical protein [Planctomycetota bacterium]